MHELTPIEARILAVLIEKERTVPDTYPLSLNSLVAGCNQKSSRDPVMNLSEREVQEALDELRRRSLVIESSGNRVMRYSHNFKRALGIPSESVALLATLMLRGPQTASELRAHCERLQGFSDLSALEAFLDELAHWRDGALVRLLPRQPGRRESRWVHLLSGDPGGAYDPDEHTPGPGDLPAPLPGQAPSPAPSAETTELRREVSSLREEVDLLREELGMLREETQRLRQAFEDLRATKGAM